MAKCACSTAQCVINNYWQCTTVGCSNGPAKLPAAHVVSARVQYELPRVGQLVDVLLLMTGSHWHRIDKCLVVAVNYDESSFQVESSGARAWVRAGDPAYRWEPHKAASLPATYGIKYYTVP